MTQPSVTVAVFPRERFSRTADALRRIVEVTDIDYKLVVVDCATPPRYWREIEAATAGLENVEVVRTDAYITPNEARHMLAEACTTDYICFTESDLFPSRGWLTYMIEACESFDAGVAVPVILEQSGLFHAEDQLGAFTAETENGLKRLKFVALTGDLEQGPARLVESAECHCLMFRKSVFELVNPFDPRITARDFIDICLSITSAGVRIVFEPRARVLIDIPPPVEPEERDYYMMRWDWDRAVTSHDLIMQKWGFDQIPSSMSFVRERHIRTSLWRWRLYSLFLKAPRKARRLIRKYRHLTDTGPMTYYPSRTAWPPNWFRNAAINLFAKGLPSREANRR
ncbi:MAG TPA: glycosyltransferase [Dehalococcoidia bacterium]|nr:glycosyltransferase [Dehalococcoidia bacterium]